MTTTEQGRGSGLVNIVGEAANRLDAWANALTGIGSAVTDSLVNGYAVARVLSPQVADSTFRGDYLARKVCHKPASDATLPWVNVVIDADPDASDEARAEVPEQAADVLAYLKRLKARSTFMEAATWARQRGGCLVFVGAQDGGQPDQPLRLDAVRSVDFLNIVRRDDVTIEQFYDDPADADYGMPKLYSVTARFGGGSMQGRPVETRKIHASRMLWFRGELTTPEQRVANGGWDDSTIEMLYTVLQRNGQMWPALAHLLNKSNVLAFGLKGFSQMLGGNELAENAWRVRMRMNKLAMSVNSWIGLDADAESIENVSVNFGGVPETAQTIMLEVCAALGWPATVVWGRSPAGQNATGESDQELWAAWLSGYREDRLQPPLEQLVGIILSSKDGPTAGKVPDSWRVEWNPLRQPTEREQAELRKLDAETSSIYIDDEVWDADEVALGRFGEQGYQRDFALDLERRRERMEARAAIDVETELEQEAALAEAAKQALAGGGGDNDEGDEGDGDKPPGKPAPGKPPGDKGDEA